MLNKKLTLFLILMMVIALSGGLVLQVKAVVAPADTYPFPANTLCAGITGDLNGDGLVNKYDGEVMMQMAKGLEPFDPCADLDGDGFIGPADISSLINFYKFLIPANPDRPLQTGIELGIIDSSVITDPSVTAESTACTLGDANGDNKIDLKDEGLLIEMTKGQIPATPAADLDGDGYIGPADLSLLINSIKFTHKDSSDVTEADVNCDAPKAEILYSIDGGETYKSSATVKKGDTLMIKAVFSKALNQFEAATLAVDNDLLSADTIMNKVVDKEYAYSLNINTDNSFTATVSVKAINGVFTDNILLTGGSTFSVVNVSFGSSGMGGGSSPACTAVNYSDWSVCTDGKSTRQLISKTPYDCAPAASQILEVDKDCSVESQVLPEEGVVLGEKYVDEREQQLAEILDDAHYIWPGDINLLLGYMNLNRDLALEQSMSNKYGSILGSNVKIALGGVDTVNAAAITNFLAYGTKTTLKLGAGERAGVLNSYKAAFSKLPQTEEDWRDAIKIGNGRWPSQTSPEAEARAKVNFEMVYKRPADMANANDNAAVTTMAYGLRPLPRNLNSEKEAIKIFKGVFGYYPVKATAWDVVRAIAYSGAKR